MAISGTTLTLGGRTSLFYSTMPGHATIFGHRRSKKWQPVGGAKSAIGNA
jgi:hypothetical protein